MSFLQRQCASLHRSLNQWRILIISYSIMQLTIIYIYEICLTFTTIALLLAQWLLNSLISTPSHFHSLWLHLAAYTTAAGHCAAGAQKHFFFAYSFCLALSLGTHVILSLLKGSCSIQMCTYLTVKAVFVCVPLLPEVIVFWLRSSGQLKLLKSKRWQTRLKIAFTSRTVDVWSVF